MTSQLQKGNTHKIVAHKASLSTDGPHHNILHRNNLQSSLKIYHFKWTHDLIKKIIYKIKIYKEKGISWYKEYERILKHYHKYKRICKECNNIC